MRMILEVHFWLWMNSQARRLAIWTMNLADSIGDYKTRERMYQCALDLEENDRQWRVILERVRAL